MKKFLNVVMQIKTNLSLSFTAMMCCVVVVAFFMGLEALNVNYILSVFLISAVSSICQMIAFSDLLFKKMSYMLRIGIFAVPFYLILSFVAIQFQWFPAESIGAWVTFSVIFLIILVVITAGFEIYYRVNGQRYDGLLGEYHRKRKKETQE